MAERRSFSTFQGASAFASWVSGRRQEEVRVDAAGNRFEVTYTEPLTFDCLCQDYVATHFRRWGGTEQLSLRMEVFETHERDWLSSASVAWHDSDTGKSWDSARLFSRNGLWETAPASPALLNLIAYGGFTDWRLPTLDELITLTPLQWANIGLELPRTQVWFDAPQLHWLDDGQFLRLRDMSVGMQQFREEHSDRYSRHDGYTESALTVFVRGDSQLVVPPRPTEAP